MFEKYLRLSIICACVFGIIGLLFITYFYNSRIITITELSSIYPDDKVYVVSGYVSNLTFKSNTLFLDLCDFSKCISGVYFNPTTSVVDSLKDGEEWIVKARFILYNDKPELLIYSFTETR